MTADRVQTSSKAHPVFVQEKGEAKHVHLMQRPTMHDTLYERPIIPLWDRDFHLKDCNEKDLKFSL
jgi:hypothetical protein